MPKLFFCSKYAGAELRQKHKLKGGKTQDEEVDSKTLLDAAITRFLSTAERRQFWSIFKKRNMILPTTTLAKTPNSSLVEPGNKRGTKGNDESNS